MSLKVNFLLSSVRYDRALVAGMTKKQAAPLIRKIVIRKCPNLPWL